MMVMMLIVVMMMTMMMVVMMIFSSDFRVTTQRAYKHRRCPRSCTSSARHGQREDEELQDDDGEVRREACTELASQGPTTCAKPLTMKYPTASSHDAKMWPPPLQLTPQ